MTAASGADRQPCGCEGYRVHHHGCTKFASGADQPTLRDQLAWQAWGVLVAAGMHHSDAVTAAHAIARNQLPLIEAREARAKAAGGAEALEQAHRFALLNWNEDNVWLIRRAASLRATTGQPPDGTPVR